jgi:coenzyme F420-reducing hydrogenase delta subunit/ferredoxin
VVERGLNAVFTPAWNPFYHLGALSFLFFWIVAISGLYLYIVFDTSVFGAYASVEWLTHEQWYLGGIMRSLHRYGSDAMVVSVIVHLSREFFYDRYRSFRWFSWISGVPLLWLMFSSGINGYWLVWDQLAQYVAIATSEFLDWLPLFGEPMARNFLNQASISDRLFSLLVFLHIGIPLMLLLGMWIHIQRIGRARVNPPAGLFAGTLLALLILSWWQPALSQGQADLDQLVGSLQFDWFYLFIYPLVEAWSAGGVWLLLGGMTLLLVALPWLPPKRLEPAAVVHLPHCNGCGRCHEDCPYSAITMQDRSDGQPYPQQAVVNNELCAACGICVGACPTATPFRRVGELIPGVDLPQLTIAKLRQQLVDQTSTLQGTERILVCACQHGPAPDAIKDKRTAILTLPCIGMLPPAFVDYAISRHLADGVLLAGCQACDCHYRLGVEWTEDRIHGRRDPRLRRRVPRERIVMAWVGAYGTRQLPREVTDFRQRLEALGPWQAKKPAGK